MINNIKDNIDSDILNKLKLFTKELLHWNKHINLIAKSTEEDVWQRHIVDSMQLLSFIENRNIHIVDLGSGAGLPAVILSIMGIKHVTLIESNSKKSVFLSQVASLSDNKIDIINDRIENISDLSCDICTSRAFATISDILSVTKNIHIRDKYLLLKGSNVFSEINDAKKDWLFQHNIYNSISYDINKGHVIEIFNKSPR